MSGGMAILSQELCLLVNVAICFGIPLLGTLLLTVKRRRQGADAHLLRPFLAGMLAFAVSQLFIRIPALNYWLPSQGWYLELQQYPYVFGVFLGLTAGIFEESARLVSMRLFLKGRTSLADGLAFGLGHGGIEAVCLTGINSLLLMIRLPTGDMSLFAVSEAGILAGGVERLFAMAFHVGASLLVLYGIRERKELAATLTAVLLHGLMDSMIVFLPRIWHVGILGIELFVAGSGTAMLVTGLYLMKKKRRV